MFLQVFNTMTLTGALGIIAPVAIKFWCLGALRGVSYLLSFLREKKERKYYDFLRSCSGMGHFLLFFSESEKKMFRLFSAGKGWKAWRVWGGEMLHLWTRRNKPACRQGGLTTVISRKQSNNQTNKNENETFLYSLSLPTGLTVIEAKGQ